MQTAVVTSVSIGDDRPNQKGVCRSNVGGINVSVGLLTNRGLVGPAPTQFSLHSHRGGGTQITPLIHLSVYSYLFSLDVVTT